MGGLLGALLQGSAGKGLVVVFGGLMVLTGIFGLFGMAQRLNIKGWLASVLGFVSGFFGGLVGNQGGLRATGLMGFKLSKVQFVATMTAVALLVDLVRVPVYITLYAQQLALLLPQIVIMSLGVVVGTIIGTPLMRRLPNTYFRWVLSVAVVVVGLLVAFGF